MKSFSEIYNEWNHLDKVDLARKVYEECTKNQHSNGKHIFALRMADDYRPFKELYVYETENAQLTIDDFIKINSNTDGLALMYPFYVGFGEWHELIKNQPNKKIFGYKLQFPKEN